MGTLWARRQKFSGGLSSKRRRAANAGDLVVKDSGKTSPSTAKAVAGSGGTIGQGDHKDESSARTNESKRHLEHESDIEAPVRPTDSNTVHLAQSVDALEPNGRRREPLAHIRSSMAVDFQRDICKQYKLRGTCKYGDSCKFLHERGDLEPGKRVDKDWKIAGNQAVRNKETNVAKNTTATACSFCASDPPLSTMKTKCGHLCCEACFIKNSRNVDATCPTCEQRLGHSADVVS